MLKQKWYYKQVIVVVVAVAVLHSRLNCMHVQLCALYKVIILHRYTRAINKKKKTDTISLFSTHPRFHTEIGRKIDDCTKSATIRYCSSMR